MRQMLGNSSSTYNYRLNKWITIVSSFVQVLKSKYKHNPSAQVAYKSCTSAVPYAKKRQAIEFCKF